MLELGGVLECRLAGKSIWMNSVLPVNAAFKTPPVLAGKTGCPLPAVKKMADFQPGIQ